MLGATVSLQEIVDLESEFKKEHEDKTPKPRKMLSWDDVKVTYTAYKLGRRSDAFHAMSIWSPGRGKQFSGLECQAGNLVNFEGEDGTEWQEANGFIPRRNTCTVLQASRYNSGDSWLRTSLIVDFYIHEDEENSADKIVLPSWAPLDILDGITFSKGDILLRTLNSFYYLEVNKNRIR